MARAAIGLSARKLAAAAKVSPETVVRFERGEKLRQRINFREAFLLEAEIIRLGPQLPCTFDKPSLLA
jgi:transcriptional regulator with XRE-family HTH domain